MITEISHPPYSRWDKGKCPELDQHFERGILVKNVSNPFLDHTERMGPKMPSFVPNARPTNIATYSPIKYAGGKRQLLAQLLASRPPTWHRYFEPFAGGATLFFALGLSGAYLSDTSAELINVYQVIRDNIDILIADLGRHCNREDYYYTIRALDPETLSPVERASRFLFLNKTCWAGLLRVNRQGRFNVPFGHYEHPNIVNADGLRAAHRVLQTTEIAQADYQAVLPMAQPEDFVYCDPPYVALSGSARFTEYTAGGFDWADHVQLAAAVYTLARRGCYVMVSNADVPAVRVLYRGLWSQSVSARRSINSDATKRAGARELIITTYPVSGAERLR